MRGRNGLFEQANSVLAGYFEEFLSKIDGRHNTRDLQILSMAQILSSCRCRKSEEAIDTVDRILEEATRRNSLSDLRAAVDLWEDPYTRLQAYEVDAEYCRGHYEYAAHNFTQAEAHFQRVANAGRRDRKEAIALHLIGVIRAKGQTHTLLQASEAVLRAEPGPGRASGGSWSMRVAQVLNTLAGVLVDLGGRVGADGGRGLPAPQSRAGREAAR